MALVISALVPILLAGCATPSGVGGQPVAETTTMMTADEYEAMVAETAAIEELAAAEAQAQAWLDAAALPPGAKTSSGGASSFNSYTGWPCRPVAQLTAYWTIPGMTVTEAANWIMANPTADLVSTAIGPLPENQVIDGASVGYIPADESQQGIVYTIGRMSGGAAVRAEIAALTASAVCPSLPPGHQLGKPGQG